MAKELQVYALKQEDGSLRIVAASTKARAAKLLDVSLWSLDNRSVEPDEEQIELANTDPGAVWSKKPGGKKWNKVSDASKAEMLPSHGGRRDGAGRSLLGETISKPRSFRMDDQTYNTFMERGGVKFLRNVLSSGLDLDDEEWKEFEKLGGVNWLRARMAAAKPKKG